MCLLLEFVLQESTLLAMVAIYKMFSECFATFHTCFQKARKKLVRFHLSAAFEKGLLVRTMTLKSAS